MIFKVIHKKMKDIWAKIKSLKAWQRFLLLIGTYALIALIISSSILVYINDVFLAEVMVDKNLSNIYNGQILNLTGVPKGATCLSFSHDNKYYTYLLNGSLYIKDCKTNSLKKQINERVPITYAIIMNDRNIVIYFFNKVNYSATTSNSVSSRRSSSSPESSSSSMVDNSSSEEISSVSSSVSSESSSNASDINSSSVDSSSDTSSLENSTITHLLTLYQYMTASSSSAPSSSTSVSESSSNGESSSKEASSSGVDSSLDNGSSSSQSNTSHESSNSQSSSKSPSSKSSSSTTYTTPSNAEKIILRTYNIDNGNNTDEQAFYANSGATIKQVVYSSLTNIIYVNTESGSKNNIVNNVYKINIMNNIWIYSYNKVIDNMVLLNNKDDLYFQDKNGYIYYNNSLINLFKNEKVKMIGRDGEDNMYFQSKTKHSTIYVVKDKKIINTITLNDLSFSHFYYTYSDIYAIYVDYIIDITKDTTKKISYDSQNTFMNIVGERIYLKNPSGQYLSLVYS